MNNLKKDNQTIMKDPHALLERMLIETYLIGKGFTLEGLKHLPKDKAKQLMKEASMHASNKLAEVELRAHLMQTLHDAYGNE